jgi:hypothetical protein
MAVLEPEVPSSTLVSLQQHTVSALPSAPSVQHHVPPIVLGEERTVSRAEVVEHWGRLLRGEEPDGVEPGLRLRIEEDGVPVATSMLSVVEAQPAARVARAVEQGVGSPSDTPSHVWLVFAAFERAKPAV